jgi:hypothetical protein
LSRARERDEVDLPRIGADWGILVSSSRLAHNTPVELDQDTIVDIGRHRPADRGTKVDLQSQEEREAKMRTIDDLLLGGGDGRRDDATCIFTHWARRR